MHAPHHHFSSSIHSTRSASTLLSGLTERSMELDEDAAAVAAAAAAAGVGGGSWGVLGRRRQLDAVRNRVSAASLRILDHYAEATGRGLADALQVRGRGDGEERSWLR